MSKLKKTLVIFILTVAIISHSRTQAKDQLVFTKLSQRTTDGDAYDVWVDENKDIAYVTCGYYGFRIFDVGDSSNPVELAYLPEPLGGYSHQLFVDNDIVYVGDGQGGVWILNCSDSSYPTTITHWRDVYAYDIQIVGSVAFVAGGRYGVNAGLTILNVSDHYNPVPLGNFTTERDATDVEIKNNHVFVPDSNAGLLILDISNYSNPVLTGEYLGQSDGSMEMGNAAVVGDLLYLAYWYSGLKILNISDPTRIVLLSEYNDGGNYFSILVQDNRAYISDAAQGLKVLDVSNPAQPTKIGEYKTGGRVNSVYVTEDLVFLVDELKGFFILKIGVKTSAIPGFELLPTAICVVILLFTGKKKH